MAHAYEVISNFLMEQTKYRPVVGIICGSGLSGLSKNLTDTQTIKYTDIPGFPEATVAGHSGELVFGMIAGVECVCMKGRFHFYEGNNMDKVVLPVRIMRMMGVRVLVVTNAAGGLNPDFEVGDIMVIQDHFGLVSPLPLCPLPFSLTLPQPCLAGSTPLRGHNDDNLGPRFPSVTDAYDPALQQMVLDAAATLGLSKKVRPNGTYCFVSGPAYESRSESRWLRTIGDTVGMSTVPEVIAAKHCGMKVLGLSLVTNKVIIDQTNVKAANHAEVLEAVELSGKDVEAIVKMVVASPELRAFVAKIPALNYPCNFLKKLAGEPISKPEAIIPAELDSENCCKKCTCSKCCSSCSEGCNTFVTLLGVAAIAWGVYAYSKRH